MSDPKRGSDEPAPLNPEIASALSLSMLSRLIRMLVDKGVISEDERATLFDDVGKTIEGPGSGPVSEALRHWKMMGRSGK